MPWISVEDRFIDREEILSLVERAATCMREKICRDPKRVLLLPPDITRAHSGAGWITEAFYQHFAPQAEVHVIPTLGQHVAHTPEQNRWMFGSIPEERIHEHDWRNGCVTLGEIPASMVQERSEGRADWPIPVSLNKFLMEGEWDLIVNVGHVVPHEVLGFANHNKNYFIGLAGKEMICGSHMMAACCGIENNLGRLTTPLRACFDYAEQNYLTHLPHCYVQVVLSYNEAGVLSHNGFYVGNNKETYLAAARNSRKHNITVVEKPLQKVIAVMQGDEFFSTWVANKAIYRTRMAMADDGELLIIAPGLKRFGEQDDVDKLIRQYGYSGTPRVMEAYRSDPVLQDLAHASAHMMHGSSEGRFRITYAPGHLSKEEIEGVCFGYANLEETLQRYPLQGLRNGFNTMADGEEVYFINTPSAGLWSTAERLYARPDED